jgi:CRP-like cAMP-binding protein
MNLTAAERAVGKMKEGGSKYGNQIIDAMPAEIRARIEPVLKEIDAPLAMVQFEPEHRIEFIDFPLTCMLSLVAITESGQSTEVGVVGNEGFAGIEVAMGVQSSPHYCSVQIAGKLARMPVDAFVAEFRRGEEFQRRVLNFVQKFHSQVSQTTLCNQFHNVAERLPRWLLMCQNRVQSDVLALTQEFLAMMLGTSRVTLVHTAQELQNRGLIKYSRGKITVLDREGLEKASCECFVFDKRESQRT